MSRNESTAVDEGAEPIGARLDSDAACRRCGYNLRGLTFDAACPECDLAVRISADNPSLDKSDPCWLRRISIGGALALFGAILALLLDSRGVPGSRSYPPDPVDILLSILGHYGAVFYFWGAWATMSAAPDRFECGRHMRERYTVRALCVIGLFTYFILEIARPQSLRPYLWSAADLLPLLVLAGEWFRLRRVTELLALGPSRLAATLARVLTVVVLAILVACLLNLPNELGFLQGLQWSRWLTGYKSALRITFGILFLLCAPLWLIANATFVVVLSTQGGRMGDEASGVPPTRGGSSGSAA